MPSYCQVFYSITSNIFVSANIHSPLVCEQDLPSSLALLCFYSDLPTMSTKTQSKMQKTEAVLTRPLLGRRWVIMLVLANVVITYQAITLVLSGSWEGWSNATLSSKMKIVNPFIAAASVCMVCWVNSRINRGLN
ncbi:hypothetical protein B0T10DRAFT_477707 [Thelonectria olida]|uniref:Uncharacterized protein n=1 Tax=Thelonectria olida TaxID=1576542 RepID=A0A9P8WF70_9HYPO|nr:hypothetical protein B0T10DRAFT_477707 [Thelonectria olida]